MENASKALIIAGGVLLSIIVIGLLVIMFTNVGEYNANIDDKKSQEQVVAFNKQFESYDKKLLRGVEVATVINKVRSNNKSYAEEPELQIKWTINVNDEASYVPKGSNSTLTYLPIGSFSEKASSESDYLPMYENIINNSATFAEFKRLFFYCAGIKYDEQKTGRVKEIIFTKYDQETIKKWQEE